MATIGVTGHRFLTETEKIKKGIDLALSRIKMRFEAPFWIISALAEGADRMVVHQARNIFEDIKLIVPLPLPIDEYLKDFILESSRTEFFELFNQAEEIIHPKPARSREQAYTDAGNQVVHLCDVLIAVWDGQDAQGIGGTGDIVKKARKLKLPIAWIHAGNRIPGSKEASTLGDQQGIVRYEQFPGKVIP